MNLQKKASENPLTAMITVIVLMASGLTAFGSLTGAYNASHTSETELLASHPVQIKAFNDLKDSIVAGDTLSKCRWLKSEIRALSDSIYVRTRDGADPDFIRSMQNDLDDLQEQYDDLNCTRRLN